MVAVCVAAIVCWLLQVLFIVRLSVMSVYTTFYNKRLSDFDETCGVCVNCRLVAQNVKFAPKAYEENRACEHFGQKMPASHSSLNSLKKFDVLKSP